MKKDVESALVSSSVRVILGKNSLFFITRATRLRDTSSQSLTSVYSSDSMATSTVLFTCQISLGTSQANKLFVSSLKVTKLKRLSCQSMQRESEFLLA